MTRRKPLPHIDPDDFGFDLVGHDFESLGPERMCLLGLTSLDRDLYYTCLRPFADVKSGDVRFASYYRFIKMLTPRRPEGSGKAFPAPTKKQLRDALDRLELFGLVRLYREAAKREGALQIRVLRRFGVISNDFSRAGYRAGGRRRIPIGERA